MTTGLQPTFQAAVMDQKGMLSLVIYDPSGAGDVAARMGTPVTLAVGAYECAGVAVMGVFKFVKRPVSLEQAKRVVANHGGCSMGHIAP